MVKHYSKRASKKRAYKKRRTVKKSKNATRRRKIQNGGFQETWMLAVTLLIPIIIAAVGGDKLLKFLEFISLFTGGTGAQGGGGVQTGGFFGISSIADLQAKASTLGANAREKASTGLAAASGKFNEIRGATPTDPASTSAALPPGKLKVALISKLTELKDDLVKEKKPVDNAATLNCIDQIINSLSKTDFDSPPPENLPSKPESVSPFETIKDGIMTEYNKLEGTQLSMVDKFKQGSITALGIIRVSIRKSIDTQTAKLLNYIKIKYRLSDPDIVCFRTLKNTFLNKFIKGLTGDLGVKITAAIEKLKQDPRVSFIFSGVDKLKSGLSGALSSAKGMFGLGSGTTPNLQATGTAITLQSRSNAETDAKTKRDLAFNARTAARNKRAAANAATKKVDAMNAAAAAAVGTSAYTVVDQKKEEEIKILRTNATTLRKDATAAEKDAEIKEAEAKAADAVFAEAKAAAAAVTQTPPPSGGVFDGLKAKSSGFLEQGKTAFDTVAKKVKKATTDNYSSTNGLTAENFKQEIIKMKDEFLKVLKLQYNIVNPDIDCLLRKSLVTIYKNFKREMVPDPDWTGHMTTGWTRAKRDENSIMPHELYKKSFHYSFGDPKPDRSDNKSGLLLDKIDDLITREDITFEYFKKLFELKPNKDEPLGDNRLTMRVTAGRNNDEITNNITKFCPPAQ